ncbi:MAG TPA: hypothetical protein VNZ44_07395 [Pyrinomonadaceae bacterium]|nr:hypothetical protein [Pyrinomonadaceae bacterium]
MKKIVEFILAALALLAGSGVALVSCKNNNVVVSGGDGTITSTPSPSTTPTPSEVAKELGELRVELKKVNEKLEAETRAREEAEAAAREAKALASRKPASAGERLREIQAWRDRENPSYTEIDDTLKEAEQTFPSDYRIPYERAKVDIASDPKTHDHPRAFRLLGVAVEKAISGGKAAEMQGELESEADGAFRKLSHGHDAEWYSLIEALEHMDARRLSVGSHGHDSAR